MTRQEESVARLHGALKGNAAQALRGLSLTPAEGERLIEIVRSRIVKPEPVEQPDHIELARLAVNAFSLHTGMQPARLYCSQQTFDALKPQAEPLFITRIEQRPRSPFSVFSPPTIFGIPVHIDNALALAQWVPTS